MSENNDVCGIATKSYGSKVAKQTTYREKALKMFPWVCGHCGRDFKASRLKELTVHHKDHNHNNNPEDGSNWELLCRYCHDNIHSRSEVAKFYEGEKSYKCEAKEDDSLKHKPFVKLGNMIKIS